MQIIVKKIMYIINSFNVVFIKTSESVVSLVCLVAQRANKV